MVAKHTGLAIFIHYPDFAELADFLSPEGKQVFLDGFRRAIEHALLPQPHWLEILEDGSAIVAIAESTKINHPKMMGFAEAVHKDLRLWTGTFGKIGIPPMKFGMGVTVGEIIAETFVPPTPASPKLPPKLSGLGVENSKHLSQKFCEHFGVQLAVEGDLARFGEHAQEWIDLDDIEMVTTPGAIPVGKRIFYKMIDREEPEDILLLKSARKAFVLKDYADAKMKFDRLSRVKHLKRFSEIYLKRISALQKK